MRAPGFVQGDHRLGDADRFRRGRGWDRGSCRLIVDLDSIHATEPDQARGETLPDRARLRLTVSDVELEYDDARLPLKCPRRKIQHLVAGKNTCAEVWYSCETSSGAILGQGDGDLRDSGWQATQIKADAVTDRAGLDDGRRECGRAGRMLRRIEEDHPTVIDHFSGVSDEEGRQVHVEVCAGRMRYQHLTFRLVDGGVLAGLEGLIQFWSPIPWFMCRQSKPGLHEARSHTRPFRAESPK